MARIGTAHLREVLAAFSAACLCVGTAAAADVPQAPRDAGTAESPARRGVEYVDCIFPSIAMRPDGSIVWGDTADVDVVVGALDGIRTYGVTRSLSLQGASSYSTALDAPAAGEGFWFLVKHTGVPATCMTARGTTAADGAEGGSLAPSWDGGGVMQRFDRDPQLPDGGCNRDTSEAWVLLSGSTSVAVVDSCTGVVVDGADLDPDAGTPGGIAFSTLAGSAGDYAFVTQGSSLVVVDVATRTIADSIDLSAELGPATLRGVAAARVQDFDPTANESANAFLYLAADLNGTPSFVVINQARLVPTVSAPVVVDSGALAAGGVALDVTPVAAPSTEGFQRAWYTVTVPGVLGPSSIRAVLVSTPQTTTPDWSVARTEIRALPAGSPLPDTLEIGAGRLGESAILPEGTGGDLTDVEPPVATYCSGGPDSDQRSVSLRGPARGSYRIFALDKTLFSTGVVRVYDELDFASGGCTSDDAMTGAGPVALDTMGQDFLVRGFTADRDGDTVTVLTDTGDAVSSETVSLGFRGGVCTDCPLDVEAQETPASSCTVQNVTVGPDKTLSWDAIGCTPPRTTFTIYCRCVEANPADCLVCPPDPARCPGCREIGEVPLEPVGISDSTAFQDTVTGDEAVEYEVAPNERQPLKVEFP